jgi:hypothetical protein
MLASISNLGITPILTAFVNCNCEPINPNNLLVT